MKIESYYALRYPQDVNLKYCGYEECTKAFQMPPHTRSEYLIHYVTSGEGVYICEGKTYPLRANDIFIIFPSQLVSYHTSPDAPLHFSWFAFTCENSTTFIERLGFSKDRLVRRLHPQYSIDEGIRSLVEQIEAVGYCNEFTVQSLLFSIFANIAESYNLSHNYTKENQAGILGHIGKAKAYIKCNYIYPITVQDVVEHVGLERSYFSKIFRKYTGITTQKYLLNIRITRSRLLLERTEYTVKEICSYVGMRDEYYFSRAFKQSVGISPSQYRDSFRSKSFSDS